MTKHIVSSSGASSQPEHSFLVGVLFLYSFTRKEDDYVGRKNEKREVQLCRTVHGLPDGQEEARLRRDGQKHGTDEEDA